MGTPKIMLGADIGVSLSNAISKAVALQKAMDFEDEDCDLIHFYMDEYEYTYNEACCEIANTIQNLMKWQ